MEGFGANRSWVDLADPYPQTPATAAGESITIWTLREIAELLD
jgi:hypothetical protein